MRKPTSARFLTLLVAGAIAVAAGNALASTVVLDTVTGNAATAGDGVYTLGAMPFGLIQIGASNLQIDRFGIYGQLVPTGTSTSANVRWDIFAANGTRVYDSGMVSVAANPVEDWLLSPTLVNPLTLLANSSYYIGLVTDAGLIARYYYPDAVTVSGTGLISPGGNASGSSAAVAGLSNPALSSSAGFAQMGMQVFRADTATASPVPLPGAALLLGSGLLGLLAGRSRRHKA